jgi:hypothetical protein
VLGGLLHRDDLGRGFLGLLGVLVAQRLGLGAQLGGVVELLADAGDLASSALAISAGTRALSMIANTTSIASATIAGVGSRSRTRRLD